MIGGGVKPSAGTIRFAGRRIDGIGAWRASRSGIARTYQIVRPFPALTLRENVALGILFGSGREASMDLAAARADEILKEVGLHGQAASLARTLTLGGRKRLEIARALGANPKLLLLDEVLAGLTPTEIEASIRLIKDLHARYRLTIVMVEHVMQALMRLCSRIVVLDHGQKIAEGTPAEIAASPAVIEAYLGAEQ
jgi:branched-chain amino acid transport system ATP-binding protein